MLESLECPNCAAPLTFSSGGETSMQCPYCRATVLLTGQSPGHRIGASGTTKEPEITRSKFGPKLIAPLLVAFVALIAILLTTQSSRRNPAGSLSPAGPASSAFAPMVLEFGSKGITPGHFESASCIAVDRQHRIYVGEGRNGRVQVFDNSGKYLSEFMAGSFDDLVADRDGTLYIAQTGNIRRYNGSTGAQLPDMERATDDWPNSNPSPAIPKSPSYYRCLCHTAGAIYAVTGYAAERTGIVKLNTTTGRIDKIVYATSPPKERLDVHEILTLTTGEIYGLDTEMGNVFKFASDGTYLNKFGGPSDEPASGDPPPSQLHWPSSMASDSQARIYIANSNGIKVYDKAGNYIATFGDGHYPYGITIDDQDNIYGCFMDSVRKYVLHKH